MAHQVQQFILSLGEQKTLGPLAFAPASIGIDNPAPFDVHFKDGMFGWARRFYIGVMLSAPSSLGLGGVLVTAKDIFPGSSAVPNASATVAYITVYEDFQSPSPGVSILTGLNFSAQIDAAPGGAGDTTIVAGVPNQNIYGVSLALQAAAAVQTDISLEDTGGTAYATFSAGNPANNFISFPPVLFENALVTSQAGQGMKITVSGACNIRGCFVYNQL